MKLNREKKMQYKSEIFEVLHENAVEMYKIGGITEVEMREYDEVCLGPKAEYNEDNDTVNLDHLSHATV